MTRLGGLVRNLRRTHERAGVRGVAELVVARALPRVLAYERATVVAGSSAGELHPELKPRRSRSLDAEIEAFFAGLASTGEPEVPVFARETLAGRFENGDELWTFRANGRIAHARWVSRRRLEVVGLSLPLRPDECASRAGVTVGEARHRGVAAAGQAHIRAVMAGEGAGTGLGALSGFNHRWIDAMLRMDGLRRVGTVHAISFAGRRWVRAAPASSDGAALLAGRGLPVGRWVPEPLPAPEDAGANWDRAAARVSARPYLDPAMAAVKRRTHLDLLDRWLPDLSDSTVMKTDLWEEGITGDELLFTLARRARAACAIDVSGQVVAKASRAAERAEVSARLLRADLRRLPFRDGEIDAVLSTSTLDHLERGRRVAALEELRRAMSPSGVLVITCDNAENLGDPLLRAAARLDALPFPLGPSVALEELRGVLRGAGFEPDGHAFLVHGPRVVTTALVRALRLLRSDRGVAALLRWFEAAGRRHPRRLGSFVAVRATPSGPQRSVSVR